MTVKIDIDERTHLVEIPIHVNGQGPFIFHLDTGASATTLTPELVSRLNLDTYSESRQGMPRAGGALQAEYATIDSLRVDSVEFQNQEVLVIDLNRRMGLGNRDGVLGHSMLKECILKLSYASHSLSLSRDLRDESDQWWGSFDYVEDTHLIVLPTSINGSKPVDFVLDTGAGSTVITPILAESLNLDCAEVNGIARGLGGDTQLRLAMINELSVGKKTVQGLQAAVIDMSRVSPRGTAIKNGILGYNFLSKCELSLDYPKQKYSL